MTKKFSREDAGLFVEATKELTELGDKNNADACDILNVSCETYQEALKQE